MHRRMRRFLVAVGVLTLALAACGPGESLQTAPSADRDPLVLRPAPPSVLVAILEPAQLSPSIAAVRALVTATARTGEHLVVLCAAQTVLSSTAPSQAIIAPAPAPPSRLPPDPTTYLESRQRTALTRYQQAVVRRTASLRIRQRRQVTAWADSATATLARAEPRLAATCRGRRDPAGPALDEAAATLASFNQIGLNAGSRKVIITPDAAPAPPPGPMPQDLLGATVVVSGFSGRAQQQAAWQGRLLAAGARRAVLLTPGAGPALAPIVDEALTGAVVESRHAAVLFRRGEATLQPAARAPLTRILRGLTTQPGAAAVISGYTDDLPTPEGNDALSTRRAVAVKRWLAAHGVASSRLQVAGQGAGFPIAPDGPDGQPANRRVEIVLDPVTSPDTG